MNSKYTINGWTFEYCEGLDGYECRGMVCYDEEHDEVPERELWVAAEKLADRLSEDYPEVEPTYSEKGWVEVMLNRN